MVKYDYSGRVALISGGTSGIGLATARAFARAGAAVCMVGRDAVKGHNVSEMMAREGASALYVRADVREEADVAQAVATTVERFGRLDFAANMAGIGGDMSPLERSDQTVWDDVMATNARGVWLAMRYQLPALLASGGGAIVNMSSIYGMAGCVAHHAYVTSKHAVLGMTRSVALEYATRGIRVNALCAGVTATASMREAAVLAPALVEGLVAKHPMARMATEDEIAGTVLWLCSQDAAYVTGTPIVVDGGFLAA